MSCLSVFNWHVGTNFTPEFHVFVACSASHCCRSLFVACSASHCCPSTLLSQCHSSSILSFACMLLCHLGPRIYNSLKLISFYFCWLCAVQLFLKMKIVPFILMLSLTLWALPVKSCLRFLKFCGNPFNQACGLYLIHWWVVLVSQYWKPMKKPVYFLHCDAMNSLRITNNRLFAIDMLYNV